MENFVYETPTKVYFGKEEELNVGKIIAGYAPKKVLVHFGGQSARKSGLLDRVEKALEAEGIAYVELGGVTANPELNLLLPVSESHLFAMFSAVHIFQGKNPTRQYPDWPHRLQYL